MLSETFLEKIFLRMKCKSVSYNIFCLLLQLCFLRQFRTTIHKSDYFALRLGFITVGISFFFLFFVDAFPYVYPPDIVNLFKLCLSLAALVPLVEY